MKKERDESKSRKEQTSEELSAKISEVKSEMEGLKAEVRAEMKELGTKIRAEMEIGGDWNQNGCNSVSIRKISGVKTLQFVDAGNKKNPILLSFVSVISLSRTKQHMKSKFSFRINTLMSLFLPITIDTSLR